MLTATLVADKVTKGTVRFVEPDVDEKPLVIYLGKDRVESLGLPTDETDTTITLTIAP